VRAHDILARVAPVNHVLAGGGGEDEVQIAHQAKPLLHGTALHDRQTGFAHQWSQPAKLDSSVTVQFSNPAPSFTHWSSEVYSEKPATGLQNTANLAEALVPLLCPANGAARSCITRHQSARPGTADSRRGPSQM